MLQLCVLTRKIHLKKLNGVLLMQFEAAWHSFTGRNIKMTNEFYRSNYGQLALGKALFSGMMVTAAAA